MHRLYEPEAYDETADAGNFWRSTVDAPAACPQVDGHVRCDFAIIGGGFTGVSAALNLAEAGFDVVLLEAERIGFGASGRCGGLIGSGQRKDVLELEAQFGKQKARLLWDFADGPFWRGW